MDDLDRLIRRLDRLPAAARIGALDEVNAQKLAYSEFGTVREPPRPALSAATDRNANAVHRAVARRVGAVIDGKTAQTGEAILGAVGADLAEEVRNAIDSNTPPALAPSTLAARRRRGNSSDRTLVDTGEMMRSITVDTKAGVGDWADE